MEKILPTKTDMMANLLKGVDEIIPRQCFDDLLESEQKLVIKLGADPTASNLHLGHTVILNKLKIFQDMGHQVVFIIGDFTAAIGDPTGKSKTRPPLDSDDVTKHAATYAKQVFKILDPKKTIIKYNSEWLADKSATDIIKLAASQTVARMLERDDFAKRYSSNQAISIHELLYPLLQGYDSVAIDSDIELGGRDQKFNLLMGRELQKKFGKKQQCIFTMPLLEGLDGINKMSKSLSNTIDLEDGPDDMFGKIMSISDDLMWRYYDLLSFKSTDDINSLKSQVANGKNPRDVKILLAQEIVARFHDASAANNATVEFSQRFAKNEMPTEIDTVTISTADSELPLSYILKHANLVSSSSEGIRMIKQGAVKIDGEKVITNEFIAVMQDPFLLQVGKRRFARIKIAQVKG